MTDSPNVMQLQSSKKLPRGFGALLKHVRELAQSLGKTETAIMKLLATTDSKRSKIALPGFGALNFRLSIVARKSGMSEAEIVKLVIQQRLTRPKHGGRREGVGRRTIDWLKVTSSKTDELGPISGMGIEQLGLRVRIEKALGLAETDLDACRNILLGCQMPEGTTTDELVMALRDRLKPSRARPFRATKEYFDCRKATLQARKR